MVGLGRSEVLGKRLLPTIDWVSADISELTQAEQWVPLTENVDVVVNAAGALQDGSKDRLSAVHGAAIVALISACERSGVSRFVQISAPGVAPNATTEFLRTKAIADHAL